MSLGLAARADAPAPPAIGELADSTRWRGQRGALAARLGRDGYVLLRGAFDPQAVRRARGEVMARLAAVGEVAEPSIDGVPTGTSRRDALEPDRGAFWRSICEGPALRALTHQGVLGAIAAEILGEAAIPFDFLWLRAMIGGRATPLHFDHSYMNRGSARVLTAWVPLGDVPVAAGPIAIVEGSHRFDDLIARHRGRDVDRDPGYSGSFPGDAFSFAAERGARLLSADFRAGDVLIFGMFTLHGSLPNTQECVRLSCDVRWQPAADPRDDRWFGSPPSGHGGTSYGGVNGARPLGSDAIRR